MVAAAYISLIEPRQRCTVALGYVVIGLIAFRLIWGLIGGKHARFADFVPSPARSARTYLRDMLQVAARRAIWAITLRVRR